MNEIKLNSKLSDDLLKVVVNEDGDAIYINPNDGAFMDRFVRFLSWLDKEEVRLNKLGEEKEKQYEGRLMVDDNGNADLEQLIDYATITSEALETVTAKVEELFGQDCIKKYFRAFYAINPDFRPDIDCINDFVSNIIPAVNTAYNTRMERLNGKYNKTRRGGKKG